MAGGRGWQWLELKLPPPLHWLFWGSVGWGVDRLLPLGGVLPGQRLVALLLVALGLASGLAGMRAFRAARTTVDPHRPDRASALVQAGVYRYTRNPMYLGLLLILLAEVLWLGNPVALLAPAGFVWSLTQLQIRPEEGVLLQLFGEDYREYTQRVRRWL